MSAMSEIAVQQGDEKAWFCGKEKEREVIATKAIENVSRFLQPVGVPVLTIVARPRNPGEFADMCDYDASLQFGWGG